MYNIDALCFCAGSPSAPGLFSHLFRFIIDRHYCLLNISIKCVLLHEHKAICVPHYIEPHSVWLQLISINACCQISFRPSWCWQISLVLFLLRCAFSFMTIKRILDVPWSLPLVYHLVFVCVLSEVGQTRFARRWCTLRAPSARRALFFTMWNETFGVRFLIHRMRWILHYVLIYLFKEIVNPLKVQYFFVWQYLRMNA